MAASAITRVVISTLESLAIGLAPTPPFQTCVMHLAAAPFSPSIDLSLAALTECTFDGYAPVTLSAWNTPGQDLSGDTVITPTVIPRFSCTGTVTSNVVYGAYITGPGTVASLEAMATLAPITPTSGQAFSVTPQIALNGSLGVCAC